MVVMTVVVMEVVFLTWIGGEKSPEQQDRVEIHQFQRKL